MKLRSIVATLGIVVCGIATAQEKVNWTTGVSYEYDALGNVKKIGNDAFVYDAAGRVVQAIVNGVTTNYEYDAFGNRTKCRHGEGTAAETECQGGYVIDASDNRNRLEGVGYDARGNVTSLFGRTYAFDPVNMMTREQNGFSQREFIYTADDERIAVHSVNSGSWQWTIRDSAGKPLREFHSSGTGSWTWTKDYVWRDGSLLASRQPEGGRTTTYHYHVDHLGTPRRITDANDVIVGIHDYHAFGADAPGGTNEPSSTRLKYTSHERDAGVVPSSEDLDYMHARYYSSQVGRFLSVDPVLNVQVATNKPQGWNRYSYTMNSPLTFDDPSGELLRLFFRNGGSREETEAFLNEQLIGQDAVIDDDGNVTLVANDEQGAATPEQQAFADVLSSVIDRTETITMNVVSGDSNVPVGQYISSSVDLGDVRTAGRGPVAGSASLFAHELIEATAKQVFRLPDSVAGFDIAHNLGNGAQSYVSGYTRGASSGTLAGGTGVITTQHTRDGKTVTASLHFVNGNLVRVERR